ncbi:MAG TPA: glycosyltransferase, partial [Phycisphaerae bacterium]|nr:glycosyltransferase [Phycisphaerae bacterium]
KFICTLRGKLVSQSRDPVRRRMIARMLRDADAVISVSQSLAKLAGEIAGRPLDIRLIPNGIDAAVFRMCDCGCPGPCKSSRAYLGWDASARYVVSVGHRQRLKGFHRLVEVWPAVCEEAGFVRLVLVGGSAGEPAYERRLVAAIHAVNQRIAPLGIEPAVSLLDRHDQPGIARLLNAADFFALASESEGWCNSIAEALACGCPVVATNVGGNSEIINHQRLGTLVPLSDSQGLVDAIADTLRRRWNRAAIAECGAVRNWTDVGRECVDVLKKVGDASVGSKLSADSTTRKYNAPPGLEVRGSSINRHDLLLAGAADE